MAWSLASLRVMWTRERRWAVLSFRLWGSSGKSGRTIRNGTIIKNDCLHCTQHLQYVYSSHAVCLYLTVQVMSSQVDKLPPLPGELEVDTCFCQHLLPQATRAAALLVFFTLSSRGHSKWQARKRQDYPHVWTNPSAWIIRTCMYTSTCTSDAYQVRMHASHAYTQAYM